MVLSLTQISHKLVPGISKCQQVSLFYHSILLCYVSSLKLVGSRNVRVLNISEATRCWQLSQEVKWRSVAFPFTLCTSPITLHGPRNMVTVTCMPVSVVLLVLAAATQGYAAPNTTQTLLDNIHGPSSLGTRASNFTADTNYTATSHIIGSSALRSKFSGPFVHWNTL